MHLKILLNRSFLLALAILSVAQPVFAVGAGITYHGRLIDPNGNPVVGSSVQFKIQLRTPGNENCLMYEEVQIKDLSQSQGIFSITINDGSGSRLDTTGLSLDQVFANRGSFSFANGACSVGTVYNTSPSDGRKIQVSFNDGSLSAGTWEPAPSMPVNFVPMSLEAMQVGGYKKEKLLRIASGVDDTQTELNSAAWTELLALVNGTSTQFVKSGAATFTAAPQWNGTPSAANDLVNKNYVDSQVAAGLPNIGTAGTYYKVTTDAKGRVTSGVASLIEADIPTLSTAGKVSGGAINSGIIAGTTSINSSGNLVTSGTVQGSVVSATNFQIFNGGNYVQLSAPPVAANLNFILPLTDGANGTFMKTNGAGQLSFAALSSSDIPNLDTSKLNSGTLPVARGGTGAANYGNNSVILSNPTGTAFSSLNCTLGQVIKFDISGNAGCANDDAGSGSQWTTSGSDIYYSTGNVGIGTASSSSTLYVLGANAAAGNAQEALTVIGGTGGANSKGGNLVLTGGTGGSGVGTGTGGDITMTSGPGGPGSGRAGAVTISGGSGGDGGGLVTVQGGSFSGSSFGAKLLLYAGDSSTTGSASLTTGNGGGTTGPVGGITLQTGSSAMGGNVGNIVIAGGAGSGTGTGSSILMTAGAGGATNINGSNIVLNGGGKGGSGSDGNVILANTRGNVGIGTSSPTSPGHVYGQNASSGIFQVESITSGVIFKAGSTTGSMIQMVGGGGTVSVAGGPATARLNVGPLTSGAIPLAINGIVGQTGDLFRVDKDTGTSGQTFVIRADGNVGIGTTTPQARLEVAGQSRSVNSAGAAQTNGAAAIDWNNGNAQTLSVDCATTTFTNMLDAGTYILAVTETGTSTCVFSQAGLTFYFSPANGARTSGQRTVYSFQRIGNDVYVSWIKGFQ